MPFRLPARLPFWGLTHKGFTFLDPGPLIDGELELIAPDRKWIDAYLASVGHPLTLQQSPGLADVTRRQLIDFMELCPAGREGAKTAGGIAPTYHFWMRQNDRPDFPIAGGVGLRIGNSYDTVMYYGHFGYHVYPLARGKHFAERACRLLLPLAARHGLNPIWITCNPDNHASRRTCERLGAQLIEVVPVPGEHLLHQRGEFEKCRYRIEAAPA
jgi:predicted acetyltransferase